MANELDKFVLEYQVELKDAINRLEQLNAKTEKIPRDVNKAKTEFQDFARDATGEIGRLIPGVDKLSMAIRGMGGELAVAGVAVAGLAAGIAAVIKMREQYGKQRTVGMEIGVSGQRLEDYQRKFSRNSGGNVTRELAMEELQKFSQKLQAAYVDPSRMSPENRQLQLLGVQVAPRGQKQIPFNTSLQQLGQSLSRLPKADVQGVAKAIGMNQDFALTLAKLGGSVGEVTELTEGEIRARENAEKALAKFNNELLNLEQSFTTMSNKLGESLIPAFAKLIEYITEIVDIANKWMPTKDNAAGQTIGKNVDVIGSNFTPMGIAKGLSEGKLPLVPGMIQSKIEGWMDEKKDGSESGVTSLVRSMFSRADSIPSVVDKPKAEQDAPQAANVKPNSTVTSLPTLQTLKGWFMGENGTGTKPLQNAKPTQPSGLNLPVLNSVQDWFRRGKEPGADIKPIVRIPEREVSGKDQKGKVSNQVVDNLINKMDETSSEGVATATQMQLAINMFNGAVSTFANAIDQSQAWAAWAGEVGRSNGLRGASAPDGSRNSDTYSSGVTYNGVDYSVTYPDGSVRNVPATETSRDDRATGQYDALFNRHGKAYGVPPDLLKAITKVESGFNPNAVSGAGAEGLMQIMPSNKKGTGIDNSFDPDQNIKAGAQLMAENLKRAGGDVREALKMYHGGLDKSDWGKYTNAYPDKVLKALLSQRVDPEKNIYEVMPKTFLEKGADGFDRYKLTPEYAATKPRAGSTSPLLAFNREKGSGESRASIQFKSVQSNVAARLGIPVQQLQVGQASRGDVDWTRAQLDAGYQNQIFDIRKQLMQVGLPEQERSRLIASLSEQTTGLELLRQYGPAISDVSNEGPREITVGERAITINVEGVQSPEEAARIMQNNLQEQLGDLINNAGSGIKY